MLSWSAILCVAVASTVSVSAQYDWHMYGTACSPSFNSPQQQVFTLMMNSTCTSGTIGWHFPQNQLVLSFTRQSPFEVCLSKTWISFVDSVKDVTAGRNKLLTPGDDDFYPCVDSAGNHVVLALTGPKLSTPVYLSNFNYVVRDK